MDTSHDLCWVVSTNWSPFIRLVVSPAHSDKSGRKLVEAVTYAIARLSLGLDIGSGVTEPVRPGTARGCRDD